jgi:transcriptional regulator with XRE-family HTH domain
MEEKRQRVGRQRLAYQMRMLRLKRGWSQETLAEVAGLHRTYISGIERAERNVGLDNVEKIAAAFGLPISELLA